MGVSAPAGQPEVRPIAGGPSAGAAPPSAAGTPAAVSASVRELMAWIAARPRTHAETMAAWHSTCPRYTPWEDALDARLVQVVSATEPGGSGDRVRLTPLGCAALGGASASS